MFNWLVRLFRRAPKNAPGEQKVSSNPNDETSTTPDLPRGNDEVTLGETTTRSVERPATTPIAPAAAKKTALQQRAKKTPRRPPKRSS
jgi:hypothetical protein